MDAVVQDLMAAIGNPDTDAPSEAMTAFEAALASGDATRIDATAGVVLAHLADGRAAMAGVVGPGCEVFCPEWDEMFSEISDAVAAMRDAANARSDAKIAAGRAGIQEALLDHFWQGIRGADPDLYVRTLRDGRIVNASRMRWSTDPAAAFDGNEETAWTTGDTAPPQWIEVDLGVASTLASVRLLTFQDGAGQSDHIVTVCGADGVEHDLIRFTGRTDDRDWLEHMAAKPVVGVRVVRVTTLVAPSTIGWREIEVAAEAGSGPESAPPTGVVRCGTRNLAAGATATGEPSASGREPPLAIDGDPATGWAPGAAGSLRITLPALAEMSEVRLLLADSAGTAARYSIVAALPSNQLLGIGTVAGSTEAGTWITLPNPTPSTAFLDLQIHVRGEAAAARILEVQVIGSPLR